MLRRVRPLEVCKAASEWLSAIRPQVGIYRSDAWQAWWQGPVALRWCRVGGGARSGQRTDATQFEFASCCV